MQPGAYLLRKSGFPIDKEDRRRRSSEHKTAGRNTREGISYVSTAFLSSKPMVEMLIPIMKKWVAGANISHAIKVVRRLNGEGKNTFGLINFLGEHYKSEKEVEATVKEYLSAIDSIKGSGIKTTVSIKPSQAGMDIGKEYCQGTMRKIVAHAKEKGIFVWIDMEGSKYIDDTVGLYRALANEFGNVGTVLQANLKRTENDLNGLLDKNPDAKIRLCKGAYKEGEEIAFKSKKDVDANFGKLIKIEFEKANNVIIASHDEYFIEMARELNREKKKYLEIQFLKGIREDYRRELSKDGVNVAVYTPYGPESVPYCIRRFRNGRGTAPLIIRSVFYG
jgi:proline dehydrogenase